MIVSILGNRKCLAQLCVVVIKQEKCSTRNLRLQVGWPKFECSQGEL